MRDRWKIAFWIVLVISILTSLFLLYSVFDQAVSLTYLKEGYAYTESDFETLIDIINQKELSKTEIEKILKNNR